MNRAARIESLAEGGHVLGSFPVYDFAVGWLKEEERSNGGAMTATLIQHPNAGHRLLFPSEATPRSKQHAHGGSDEADAELGRSAWDAIQLFFGSDPRSFGCNSDCDTRAPDFTNGRAAPRARSLRDGRGDALTTGSSDSTYTHYFSSESIRDSDLPFAVDYLLEKGRRQ